MSNSVISMLFYFHCKPMVKTMFGHTFGERVSSLSRRLTCILLEVHMSIQLLNGSGDLVVTQNRKSSFGFF
jgi:hypothetical protein